MNTRGHRILSRVTAVIGNVDDSGNSDQKYDLRAVREETTCLWNYMNLGGKPKHPQNGMVTMIPDSLQWLKLERESFAYPVQRSLEVKLDGNVKHR